MTEREIQQAKTKTLLSRLSEIDRLIVRPLAEVELQRLEDEEILIMDELAQRRHDHEDASSGLGVHHA